MYVCCAKLWSGGEDGNGGEWVEPVKYEEALQEGINSGVGVEGANDFVVGGLRVVNEGGKGVEVKRDLNCVWASEWEERLSLEVSARDFNVVE